MAEHDLLFRSVFSEREHAAGLLRSALPASLVSGIDWSTLRARKASFIDRALRETHSDVLVSVRMREQEAFVYVLLEHQSTSDRLMPFRLLRYMVRIWEKHLATHPDTARLPPIVPVVVYHGERAWAGPTTFSQLLWGDAALIADVAPFSPSFRFVLDDLSSVRAEQLAARVLTALGRLTLFCLARARQSPDLLGELSEWRDVMREVLAEPNGVAALAKLMSYVSRVTEPPRERFRALLEQLGPKAEEVYMSIADTFIEQGRAEGRAQGRAEGRADFLLMQLERKYGALPEATRRRVQSASDEELAAWGVRVLTATVLDDVFVD